MWHVIVNDEGREVDWAEGNDYNDAVKLRDSLVRIGHEAVVRWVEGDL